MAATAELDSLEASGGGGGSDLSGGAIAGVVLGVVAGAGLVAGVPGKEGSCAARGGSNLGGAGAGVAIGTAAVSAPGEHAVWRRSAGVAPGRPGSWEVHGPLRSGPGKRCP